MPFWKAKSEKKDHEQDHASQQASLILSEDLKVVKDLGEGQYGVVQLGEWKPLHKELKHVAIKSIKNTASDGVLQEAHIMQRLRHDNIVIFYGISLPSGEQPLRLVTEFAPHGALKENLENKNVCKVSTLCKFASQVAHGMHYLASQQLVHRDLATRNILLFDQDLVKISDFGLARSLEGDGMKQITFHTKLAVAWMPPEAIEKGVFTPAGDVWSYGITLWEMFSFGQQPWPELSLRQMKQMMSTDPSKRLVKPYACPDGFYELIMLKCWAREPKDRLTFGYIINNVLPQLQPKEGTTKVCYKSAVKGHLSYGSREKVTVISRVGDGMLLVQSGDNSIGLIDQKHVEFPKKSGGTHSMQISRPFEVTKRDSREVLAELHKIAGEDNDARFGEEINTLLKQTEKKQPDQNLLDLDEDDVALDPNYMLYPDPYPAMTDWANTGAAGLDTSSGEGTDEEDYTSMDHMNASLKVVKGQENLTRKPDFQIRPLQRSGRTMSESEVLAYDTDYEVPFQNIKGSKDDSSVQLGSKGTPGGKKSPPVIPARLDRIYENGMTLLRKTTNDTCDRGAGLSPYATTPRKRPIPTPRRQKTVEQLRPVSDSFVYQSANSDLEESITRSNTEIRVVPGTQSVACADGQKKVRPKPPLPYESTKIVNDKGDTNGSVKSGSEKSDKHECLETTGDKEPDQSAQADSTKNLLPTVCVAQHGDVTASIAPHGDVTASVTTHGDVTVSVTTHGDITASIAPRGDFTSSVVPHSDVTAFKAPRGAGSGESASRSVTSHVPLVQDMSSESQPPVLSFNLRDLRGLYPQPRYENSSVIEDLIDFSHVNGDCPPLPPKQHAAHAQETPLYDKPLSLAMYPDIPAEVLNQPPSPPEELFGGTAPRPDAQSTQTSAHAYSTVSLLDVHGGLVTSHQPPRLNALSTNPLASSIAAPVYPAVEHFYQDITPVNPAVETFNPALGFVNPNYDDNQPVNRDNATANALGLTINSVKPAFKLVNPDLKPTNPAVNLGSAGNERSYGDEIDAGIQEIREVCGIDISRDWCYAALLQYQGDVQQVVRMIKTQNLAKITGKTEQFCTRTLTHCNWDLDRAANYILENYEDKDV